MNILAIDPGMNGGIALFKDGWLADVTKMPPTPADILSAIRSFSQQCGIIDACYLEKVGGMPGQGGMAMFHFGENYGMLEMALIAEGIPAVSVTPQKWQKFYQLGKSGEHTKTEWKNMLKARAQALFPRTKVTLAIADALLIGNYGIHQEARVRGKKEKS